MIDRLRRWFPSHDRLRGSRWLRWLGPALQQPRLWQWRRRGLALGLAVGMFFGVLFPVAQIPLSAGLAVVLRANLPAAVASTLVTNPVTTPPLYYAAWRLGSAILHRPLPGAVAAAPAAPPRPTAGLPADGWWTRTWQRLRGIGKPLMLGLVIVATTLSMLVYVAVNGFWTARVLWARRQRRLQRALRAG